MSKMDVGNASKDGPSARNVAYTSLMMLIGGAEGMAIHSGNLDVTSTWWRVVAFVLIFSLQPIVLNVIEFWTAERLTRYETRKKDRQTD